MRRVLRGVRPEDLAEDLAGGEIACEAHGAGQAERAGVPAADLRGQAERYTAVVRHHHARHAAAVVEAEDELAAAVLRRRLALDLRQRGDGTLGDGGPELPWQVAHRVEIDDALAIDPRGELAATIARGAQLHREVFHLGRQHSDEVGGGHRTKNNTVLAL